MTETKSPIVYVNARPESVLVREAYCYEIKIRANPDTRLVDQPDHPDRPRGEISVEMPYDGHACFPAESARLIRGSADRGAGDLELSGQIGWLALSRPLDWEREWKSPEGMDLLPVQIPLLDEHIQDPDMWGMDELRAVNRHEYRPENPDFTPVQVEMRVSDTAQDSLDPFLKTRDDLLKGQNISGVSDILKKLNGDPLQGGQLVIDVAVTVFLPSILARQVNRVIIDELELNWPTIASDWQLGIFAVAPTPEREEEKVEWRYDPDHQTVEVHSLTAHVRPSDVGVPFEPYRCNLRIRLYVPGGVVSQDELEGKVRLRLDGCLLSGRQAAWLDASGRRMDTDEGMFTVETLIEGRFNATLSDRFRFRRTAAYRQLNFPGVMLSPTRLDDIAAALRDIGYRLSDLSNMRTKLVDNPALLQIKADQRSDGGGWSIEIGSVVANRIVTSPDQDPAVLAIQVWAVPAAPAATRREREIPEGGLVATEWGTSDLILQMRGTMDGSGSMLSLDMDRLMINLKNRFGAVADMR